MTATRASRKQKPVSVEHAMSAPEAMIDMHGVVKTFKNAAGSRPDARGRPADG